MGKEGVIGENCNNIYHYAPLQADIESYNCITQYDIALESEL